MEFCICYHRRSSHNWIGQCPYCGCGHDYMSTSQSIEFFLRKKEDARKDRLVSDSLNINPNYLGTSDRNGQ